MSIELVILDVDGVMTDGRKYYDLNGMPFAKTYCDKDFTAIKRLKGAGVKVVMLSGDNTINEPMANNRNIDFYYARGKDKADFVPQFESTYNTSRAHMLYIGDDLFDKSIMQTVGHPYCPNDACRDVKQVCGFENVLKNNGGCNVICELVELLIDRKLVRDCSFKDIESLDKKEKF
jgi:3-deoxy-D-manno-octulosonate 8-phosphate phosphatase (KDO 8-P phosphatase)